MFGIQFIIVLFIYALAAIITILWLIIGWRAMRAHEKLADSMEWLARQIYRKEQDRKEQDRKEQDSVSSIED